MKKIHARKLPRELRITGLSAVVGGGDVRSRMTARQQAQTLQ